VLPSPKSQAYENGAVPPVTELIKLAVLFGFTLYVKLVLQGVGAAVVTITTLLIESRHVNRLSEVVKVIVYVPAAAYMCVGAVPLPIFPSPKLQSCVKNVFVE
jgi:hypothetical protein